ncbi:MAG: PSD1 domain-containing protein, partial [Verrucomicrobiales bacterium]|nr:PSD1 domain-containing protein [Verrucomicrobiales bacterium]
MNRLIPLLLFLAGANPALSATDAERLFTLKVGPLIAEKCNGCHGDDPDKIKGEFKSLTREDFLKGGESFDDILVPGDASKSRVLEMVRWQDPDYEMPPKENDRLTPEQIAHLESWIQAGAPWPNESMQAEIRYAESHKKVTEDGILVETSGGLGDDWTFRRYKPEDVWAFQPVVKPEVPKVEPQVAESRLSKAEGSNVANETFKNQKSSFSNRDSKAATNPIDAFIGEKLAAARVAPAPPAAARTLIRRIRFDLTGLPPTPEEVAAFEKAHAQDPQAAVRDLTKRLLDSPHYGERWAQHWLDVARYADTGGMSNDYERSNAWRYRDYVIRAFNDDKPYDQFVMEQLAGDELAELKSNPKPKAEKSELLVATGFLRMGPWDPAMVKNEEARQLYLDDVVNSVGQTFLATTMRCLKCHDHKFDPLPTRDYYRIYATFAGTQIAERPAPFTPEESCDGFEEGRAHVQRLLDFATAETQKLVDKREAEARRWYAEHKLPYKDEESRKDDADEIKPPRHCGLSIEEQGQLKVREQDVWIWTRRLERYQPLAQSVYNGPDPKFLNARKLRMPEKAVNASWKPDSHILTGGSLEAPGDPVGPGVLSALGVAIGASETDPYLIPDNVNGRRLALAKWITDPRNPLTARAIVNRIWQHHFGKPLAGNPNNFGAKGAKPTHPKLLDWLAADFMEHGWKIKHLHQLILAS